MIFSSCSVLTTTQLEMVENLSFRSDSVANAPKILFEGLSEIRLERGLYYASSLSSPQARAQELGALADGVVEDRKIAEKSQLYVSVLNSYLRALKSASSQSRWSDVGVELRSIGRNIDSLFIRYNKLGLDEEIPTGFAKHAGKTFGLIGEEVMKVKQTNFVKDFVLCGDSLVAESCDALVEILKGKQMTQLIDNEIAGLESNYYAYLMRQEQTGNLPSIQEDRHFIELTHKGSELKGLRNKCVSALRSLKNTHHKLYEEFSGEEKVNVAPQILEFYNLSEELCRMINNL